MKTASRKMEAGTGMARSVLDCGGKSDATPLSRAGRFSNRSQPSCARKLRRRCAPVFAALRPGRLPEPSKTWRHLAASLVLLVVALTARAQSYSIDWFTIDDGGGTSTGGVYSVSGSIGQPDAGGAMTNGQYSVTGGFWVLPQAVQVTDAPTLAIVPAGTGQATISWTPNTPGFVLQENMHLGTTNWINSPSGTNNPVTVPAVPSRKFYRLSKP